MYYNTLLGYTTTVQSSSDSCQGTCKSDVPLGTGSLKLYIDFTRDGSIHKTVIEREHFASDRKQRRDDNHINERQELINRASLH